MHDVIVIGGSYAGMAATLQLVRARRSIHIIDAGERRNRFASHSHGFLGQDGVAPGQIAADARRQLGAYPALTWSEGRAVTVSEHVDGFAVTTADGAVSQGRRILLATGLRDQLPEIPGLQPRWGRSVFHCPYCHGYELDRGRIGIVGVSAMSVHQAELLSEWGDVTLLVNDAIDLTSANRQTLENRGVAIETSRIDRIEGHADVMLVDGRMLGFAGLFTVTRTTPSAALADSMGCELEETALGTQVRIDAESKTSIAGVFACGDVARAPHSVSLAVGHGAMAGIHLHRSLVWPDTVIRP